ncbi:phospho-sugar mutase [uncultured Planktosalinus sp.]|uniref:phospho-sugar mutase n=1 Tax=uncultured Planktosalinus sp. TaxID=1810935 RepID=UPI0030DDC13E
MIYIKPEILEKVNQWLTPVFDINTQQQIKELIAHNPKELEESFYQNISFGTGGMRGIVGVGNNRINKYTLGKNTQGISNYIKKQFPGEHHQVAIAYDCRHNSAELAKVVADVFSANDIKVYLFSELRPTPELSFAVTHLECHCGIVLTASHNPPEYNGYKVYWNDGGQLVPPQDVEVIEEINVLKFEDIQFEAKESLIQYIDTDIDEAFINASLKNGSFGTSKESKANLKIVFTSLHGTSIKLNPIVLERAGYSDVHIVKEQAEPNGDFPTVKSPNPEEPEALKMALALADKTNADIVIGTDPDGDRLGVAVRNPDGRMTLLNGNQTMAMMSDFLLNFHSKNNSLQGNAFIASTIVSTPMMLKIAEKYTTECKVGLTGFKWIAKMIKDHPAQQFIGGGEESFGYMVSDFVRDKDSVTATLLACEMAAQQKEKGKTLYDYLISLYQEHGFYKEHLVSMVKKGIEGAEEIKQIMVELRANPLKEIAGSKVTLLEDYQTGIAKNHLTGSEKKINIPTSNVLIYYTEDGTKVAARPSGTEPKIKFYISVNLPLLNEGDFKGVSEKLDEKIESILKSMNI